jgi:hypothetical protein
VIVMKRPAIIALALVCGALWAPATEAPRVNASLNGAKVVRLYRGWPALLRITVAHPQPLPGPGNAFLLSGDNNAWSSRLTVAVRSDAAAVTWPFQPVGTAPGSSLLLEPGSRAEAGWFLTPAETRSLIHGEYAVAVLLDTADATSADAWKGTAPAPIITVIVDDEPEQTPQLLTAKAILLAQFDLWRDDSATALARVEDFLNQLPESPRLLQLKGDLTAATDPVVAAEAYSRALQALPDTGGAARAPLELYVKLRAVLLRILADAR